MVRKTLRYSKVQHQHGALVLTDDVDDGTQRSFGYEGRRIRNLMPKALKAKQMSLEKHDVNLVRSRTTKLLNEGVGLTVWMGHSSQRTWGMKSAFRRSDIRALKNGKEPTMVLQFGCWNSYHVDPARQSLAHEWLLGTNRGAAAVLGASTLTDATAEQLLSDLVVDGLAREGLTLGEALLKAKRELVDVHGMESVRDVVLGVQILGDPAIRKNAAPTH